MTTLLERYENIALSAVGEFVQRCLAAGATLVVVTIQPDGFCCTISVQRD